MVVAIELQVISRIITSEDNDEIESLLAYAPEKYFNGYIDEINYIHGEYARTGQVPDRFEFQLKFPAINLVDTSKHSIQYLENELKENRKNILFIETMNKLNELSKGDINDAWKYVESRVDEVNELQDVKPMDIVHEAIERSDQIKEYAKQRRIPTGFPEIDKAMYGGFSTIEELVILVARTNSGKSWCCTKMMESAQANGFPCAYYSPEMQAEYLATRFDTWRKHFENNKLYKGEYSEDYVNYLHDLAKDENCPAYVLEDKHFSGSVSVKVLEQFVKKHGIKLLIVDGISYMKDDENSIRDQEKFKNIALGLFKLSKKYGCAVVLVMQANREVKSKDSKESIPDLFNAEGSDQPGRIATQAFGIRQIFEEHKLEIKLLKSRMSNNQNPVFAYNWSINDGNLVYLEDYDNGVSEVNTPNSNPGSFRPISFGNKAPDANDLSLINDSNSLNNEEDYGDVEF